MSAHRDVPLITRGTGTEPAAPTKILWLDLLRCPLVVLVWSMALGMVMWGSGLDVTIQRWLYANYHQPTNDVMRWISTLMLGRTLVWCSFLAGIYLAWRAARPVRPWRFFACALVGCLMQLREWAYGRAVWTPLWDKICDRRARILLLVLPTLAVAGTCQLLLKGLIGRPRPKEVLWNGLSAYDIKPTLPHLWYHNWPNSGFLSFPSGHSCSTWAVAVLLMHVWPRHAWLIAIFATVGSVARFLAVTPHYPGDVIAGAGLGAAVALVIAKKMRLTVPAAAPLTEAVSEIKERPRG